MIYDVFLPFLIIFSIFSIIIILARKIPAVSSEQDAAASEAAKEGPKPHLLTAIFCFLLASSEKILRQIRIHLLKIDAKIFSLIEYLRKESAKKLDDVNKLAHNNIAKTVVRQNAHKISHRLQFKMEERKLLYTIARNPKEAENYKKLGLLYLDNDNSDDAEAAFGEYLKLKPDDAEAKELLGKIAKKEQAPS